MSQLLLARSQLAKPDEHDSTGLNVTFTESGLKRLLVTADNQKCTVVVVVIACFLCICLSSSANGMRQHVNDSTNVIEQCKANTET